jgi:hypothetical protein
MTARPVGAPFVALSAGAIWLLAVKWRRRPSSGRDTGRSVSRKATASQLRAAWRIKGSRNLARRPLTEIA